MKKVVRKIGVCILGLSIILSNYSIPTYANKVQESIGGESLNSIVEEGYGANEASVSENNDDKSFLLKDTEEVLEGVEIQEKETAIIINQYNSANTTGWYWPVPGHRSISQYYKANKHEAIDITASEGTPIYATKSGTVRIAINNCSHIKVGDNQCVHTVGGYDYYDGGNQVYLKHDDGSHSVYAHMIKGSVLVSAGQRVEQGQKIGEMGQSGYSTGVHLHFGVSIGGSSYYSGQIIDPLTLTYDNNSAIPQPSNIYTSITTTEITETTAKINTSLNGTYNVTTCGFYIGTSPDNMSKVTENANTQVNTIWYSLGNGSKWMPTLERGTTYYYQFYATINGVEHKSSINTFKTLGKRETNPPVISNVNIERISEYVVRVSCQVTDDSRISKVSFPTWTDHNGQDDIIWKDGVANGSVYTFDVNVGEHNYENGQYIIHIYAYDECDNSAVLSTGFYFDNTAPVISDIKTERISYGTVRISCQIEDQSEITKVSFPTWTEYNGQDDLIIPWEENYTGIKNNSIYSFDIKYDEHNDEMGKYLTHIYAWDKYGNQAKYETSFEFLDAKWENVKEGLWVDGIEESYTYTGKGIKPVVQIYDGTTLLTEKVDYTLSYKNNINANDGSNPLKAPMIIVTGKGNYKDKEIVNFVISPKSIASADITVSEILKVYNNKIQKPLPTIKDKDITLKHKVHYTVEYPDVNPDAYKASGTYRILIHGKGNYTGTKEITFKISELKKINSASISSVEKQKYTGQEIKPSISVRYGKKTLIEGTHYTISYKNNKNVGTGTIIISGKGDYIGEKRVNFKITGTSLTTAKVTGIPESVIYTGGEIRVSTLAWPFEPRLKIENNENSIELEEGQDYSISYQSNKNAGKGTIIFTGINGYTGSIKKSFRISAYDIQNDEQQKVRVTLVEQIYYEKGGNKPKPVVSFGNIVLKEGKDYTLSYKNNLAVSNDSNSNSRPVVIIKGKGNFSGQKTLEYRIQPRNIAELSMEVVDKVFQNKKNSYKSIPKVKDFNNKILKAGSDYGKDIVYRYKNRTVLLDGTIREANATVGIEDIVPVNTIISVSVEGKGNYTGTLTEEYRISQMNISKAKVMIPTQVYTGKAIKPDYDDIKISYGKTSLGEDDYIILNYSNNIKKGTATVTIQGIGDFCGKKTIKFTIKSKQFLWWFN